MLKNPKNSLATNSRICAATLGISADCAVKARGTVTGEEGRLLAGSPSKFRRSLCLASRIVIDPKIRVFQQNRRNVAVAPQSSNDCYPPKGEVRVAPIGALSNSRGFPPDLRRWLVRAEADVNRVTQEAVCRPGQIGDLGDERRLDPKNERRAEASAAGLWEAQRRRFAGQGVQATPQIGEHLDRHSCAHAAGVDE